MIRVHDDQEPPTHREGERLAGQRYRLVPLDSLSSTGPGDEGPIAIGEASAAAFLSKARQVTQPVVVCPVGYPLPPPGQGTTFRVVFLTGDHGGLIPAPVSAPDTPDVDVVVWLPGPTRDVNAPRGLTAHARLLRVATISRDVVAPVAVSGEPRVTPLEATHATFANGKRLDDLDQYGKEPHDLEVESRKLWGTPAVWARQFGRELGQFCAQRFRNGRPATSSSTLRSPASGWEWNLAGALAAIPAAALVQLHRRGRSWLGWWRFLIRFGSDLVCQVLAVAVVAFALTSLYAAVAPGLWTYGRPMVALRLGIGAAAMVALAPAVSLALALLASRIWPGESLTPTHARRARTSASAWARAALARLAGVVLLGAALGCFAAFPVRASGAGLCVLLPSTPGLAVAVGLGLWLLAATCLLAGPTRNSVGLGGPGVTPVSILFQRR